MKKVYIITGAGGHLGSTLIRILTKKGQTVRGLLFGQEWKESKDLVTYIQGDVTDKASLEPLFEGLAKEEIIVIHAAGIVDISEQKSEYLYEVNVRGTQNMIALCMKHKVSRMIYVGSVHAIPEGEPFSVIKEAKVFSPEKVVGDYAKSKALAAQCVVDAVKEGLKAVSVFPSGILGPFDTAGNHLVQLVDDYRRGKVPAGVRGGYDFVDVRDVALGCLAAVKYGNIGEGYILSNRHYEIKDLFSMIRTERGGRKVPMLPIWVARASVSTAKFYAKMRKQRPLFTKYSLYTLRSNDRFSHDKATAELHYYPRDLRDTIRDTIRWLEKKHDFTTIVR